MQWGIAILLFAVLNTTFEQYKTDDVSFILNSLSGSIVVVAIVTLLVHLIYRKKNTGFSYADILFVAFVAYYIFRYDMGTRLADWKIIIALLSVVLWFAVRHFLEYQLCSGTTLSWVLMLSGGMQALWGFLQLHGFVDSNHSLFSMTGSFLNPGPYSGYIAMIIPIALYQSLISKGIRRYVALGILGMILCMLPAGMSRSAWLGAALSSCIVILQVKKWPDSIRNYRQRHNRLFALGIIGNMGVIIIVASSLFMLKEDSAYGRLFIWKNAWHSIVKAPLAGSGSATFSIVYPDAQAAYFKSGDYTETEERVAGNPEYAFNEYVQMLVEGGLILLTLFVIWIFYTLRQGWMHKEYGLCGAVISLLVFAFFSYPFQLPSFLVAGILMLASLPQKLIKQSRWFTFPFSILLIVLSSFCTCYYRSDAHKLSESWEKCRLLKLSGAADIAIKGYERLYTDLKDNPDFLFEYARCLTQQQQFKKSNEILRRVTLLRCDAMIYNVMGKNYQMMKYYERAESCFLYAANLLPGRIYPYYLLAKLYAEPNFLNKEKVEQMAHIVLTKQPKVESKAIDEMRIEVRGLLENLYSAGKKTNE